MARLASSHSNPWFWPVSGSGRANFKPETHQGASAVAFMRLRMLALTAGGTFGQSLRSSSIDSCDRPLAAAPTAPDSAPPGLDFIDFPRESAICSAPGAPIIERGRVGRHFAFFDPAKHFRSHSGTASQVSLRKTNASAIPDQLAFQSCPRERDGGYISGGVWPRLWWPNDFRKTLFCCRFHLRSAINHLIHRRLNENISTNESISIGDSSWTFT
jgi:hypothetical protein